MKIATYNVNSVRSRLDRTAAFLERHSPDLLCLQETKVCDPDFPRDRFLELGYQVETFGQKSYNGVAILSKSPLERILRGIPDGSEDPQCRLISAEVDRVRLINVYVPNGFEVGSQKFAYKLQWLERLRSWMKQELSPDQPIVLCGDFNIAPDDRDVYDPDAWRGQVLFHPAEHRELKFLTDWGLVDAFRLHHQESGLYSWWDFRGGMFWKNQGLRIDHFLVTGSMAKRCTSVEIDVRERKGKQPSDHAPVIAVFD